MKRSILGSRALRVACACALALGIAPAAAWGAADGEDSPNNQIVFDEEPSDNSAEIDGTSALEWIPSSAQKECGHEAPANQSDAPKQSDQVISSDKEDAEGDGSIPASMQYGKPFQNTQEVSDYSASLDNSLFAESQDNRDDNAYQLILHADHFLSTTPAVDVVLHPCPYCRINHAEPATLEYELIVPEGEDPANFHFENEAVRQDAYLTCDYRGATGTITVTCKFETPHGTEINVVRNSDNQIVASAWLEIETPTIYDPCATPKESIAMREGSSRNILESFDLNEAAQYLFGVHAEAELIEQANSQDPSVASIELQGDKWIINALQPGETVIRITPPYEGSIDFSSVEFNIVVEPRKQPNADTLKFTQQTLNLTAGQSFLNGLFFESFISGKDSVNWSFYLTTSDQSVLSYQLPEEEPIFGDGGGGVLISACKPGTAKLYLYFYNPETEESILTDTMTVNVKAASPTASSTPGSAYAGDIVSSGAADDIVKLEGLSLATSVKSPDSLTADQRQGLLEVTNTAEGEKAVLVDISLVRSDGTVFDGYDELDSNYVFTVRLKLEGDLAGLDADTIRTYRIHKDGGMEPITCWVHDGYLYISTRHFSPYAIVGQAKSATGGNTGGVGNGSQGGNAGTNDTQGGSTTTVADKGNASGTSTAKNDAAKASDATRSGAPLAQTGDSLLPLAATLGVATILGAAGLAVARRRMNRW